LFRRPAIILKLNLTLGRPARSSIATIVGEAIMKSSLRQTATPQHRSRPRRNDRPRSKTLSSGHYPRRQFLGLAAGTVALPAMSRIAWSQAYPTRPVRIIVGFAPGGSTDLVARLVGKWLSERLRQQFFVETRTGAASNIATEAVVRAAPDGYTLLMATNANAINATLYEHLNFNFIRDTVPIAGIMSTPLVMLVNPLFPATTVPAFIAHAKSNPGKINMASAGNGSLTHMFGELFNMIGGVNVLHVPYRGESAAIADLLGGQVQVSFPTLLGSIEHIRDRNLRALAVTTATRSSALPDVPTMTEFLAGCEATAWNGLNAPKNTPAAIVEQLNTEINAALADPEFVARLAGLGGSPLRGSPTSFAQLVAAETEKWAKVIRAANIKPV
jgi:tripartite-type tricarboxylate transporter receptor subunit TctC